MMFSYTTNYDTIIVSEETHHLDNYRDAKGVREIQVTESVHLSYVAIVRSGQIDISCHLFHPHASADIRVIYIGKKDTQTQSTVTAYLETDHTRVDVYMLSLLADESDITVHGNVTINPRIVQAEGYLVEENIILGQRIKVKTLPMLDVRSNDVRASHGCKIERIDPKRLFYMQSRGLDGEQSKGLILDGYINNFFSSLQGQDDAVIAALGNEIKETLNH